MVNMTERLLSTSDQWQGDGLSVEMPLAETYGRKRSCLGTNQGMRGSHRKNCWLNTDLRGLRQRHMGPKMGRDHSGVCSEGQGSAGEVAAEAEAPNLEHGAQDCNICPAHFCWVTG